MKDGILFLLMWIISLFNYIFTIQGSRQNKLYRKVLGLPEESARIIHRVSFWGLLLSTICVFIGFIISYF